MNTWWIRKKWEASKTQVQEIKQNGATAVQQNMHACLQTCTAPPQLCPSEISRAANKHSQMDRSGLRAAAGVDWKMLGSQHQRDTRARCGAAAAFADPTRRLLLLSTTTLASTVHTAARPLPLEVAPWRRTQTEAQQTAGRDRPANKGAWCHWTKGPQGRGHSIWCNRWKHAQDVFLWKAKQWRFIRRWGVFCHAVLPTVQLVCFNIWIEDKWRWTMGFFQSHCRVMTLHGWHPTHRMHFFLHFKYICNVLSKIQQSYESLQPFVLCFLCL